MNPSPRISVLMTSFNPGRFLEPAVDSIRRQAFRDWEMVVVDDASTDGSAERVEGWAKEDPRIRLFRNPVNIGQTASLNLGLAEVRGEWVARQDADDLSHPLRLTRQFEAVSAQPQLALLGTCGRIVDANNRLCGLLDVPLTPAAIAWAAPFVNPFLHTAVLFRTEIVRERLGGYDPDFRIAQDYELWTRIAAGHPCANLPQRLVAYRHIETSLSKTGRGLAFAEAGRVSRREAQRAFGNALTESEHELLAAFREGLSPGDRRAFWGLYRPLRDRHADRRATRAITAAFHLHAAGALAKQAPVAAGAEIAAALAEDWRGTLAWFRDRVLG